MMRNLKATGATMLMLFEAGWAQACVGEIVNGSFEDDGPTGDITAQEVSAVNSNGY